MKIRMHSGVYDVFFNFFYKGHIETCVTRSEKETIMKRLLLFCVSNY